MKSIQPIQMIDYPKQLQLASIDRVALDTNLLGLGKDNQWQKYRSSSRQETTGTTGITIVQNGGMRSGGFATK